MKALNIKKELRAEADKYTPDVLDKVKLVAQSQNLLPCEGKTEDYAVSNTKIKSKIKGKTFGIISSAAAFLMAIILIIVFLINGAGEVIPPIHIALSANNAYGFGAVSSIKLLGKSMPTAALNTFSTAAKSLTEKATEPTPSYIDSELWGQLEKFNNYFIAFDNFLSDEILNTEIVENSDKNYNYNTKMTIKTVGFNGDPIVYYMYYSESEITTNSNNKVNTKSNTKTLLHGDSEHDDNGDDKNSGVTYTKFYNLVGVMVVDGKEYYLEGVRSLEAEYDESESELEITAYASMSDRSSYIRMNQETTTENGEIETDYVYSVYSGGKLIETTKVDFETQVKHGKKETRCGIYFIVNGSVVGAYSIKKDINNGKVEIKVNCVLNGKSDAFTICEKKNQKGEKCFEYKFKGNHKLDLKAH